MRYTTVIDISEISEIYKNPTARLLYLHMSLKAGYHDADRDLVRLSIRRLSADVGVTVSATRHALHQLERVGLLTREGELWRVKKWVEEQQITTRARTKRELQEQIQVMERQRQQAVLEKKSQERQEYNPEEAINSDGFKRIQERFGLTRNKKK